MDNGTCANARRAREPRRLDRFSTIRARTGDPPMALTETYALTEPSRTDVDLLDGPTLLEFGAPWCGHCRAAQPLLAQAMAGRDNLRHLKIEDGPGRPLGRSFRVKLWRPTSCSSTASSSPEWSAQQMSKPSTRCSARPVAEARHRPAADSSAQAWHNRRPGFSGVGVRPCQDPSSCSESRRATP